MNNIFKSICSWFKTQDNPVEIVSNVGVEVPVNPVPRSLCAIKSDTEKSVNQDACGCFCDENSRTIIMAVADGIGSNQYVEVGSRFVVDTVLELIASGLNNGQPLDYTSIFADVQEQLTAMIDRDYAGQTKDINRKDFGTTLIVGIDTPETFTLAYIGNGCAYYIMGDFVKFPDVFYLPWSVNNLLVPHSLPDEVTGQETLYKYFSYHPTNTDQCVPTVITVSKNHHAGEIFVIATDGLDSLDKHDGFAFNDDDELMIISSWSMSLLCSRLKKFLEESLTYDDVELGKTLDKYMITLRNEERMDDDVTIGIVMSPKVSQKMG